MVLLKRTPTAARGHVMAADRTACRAANRANTRLALDMVHFKAMDRRNVMVRLWRIYGQVSMTSEETNHE
jgi:hypothetical protein